MTTYNHQEWQYLLPLILRKTVKVNTKIASYYMYGGISFTQDS